MIPLMREWDAVLGYRIDLQGRPPAADDLLGLQPALLQRLRPPRPRPQLLRSSCSVATLLRAPPESDDFFIDTELVVRLHRAGFRYVEHGVTHLPRLAGRLTVRLSDIPGP